MAIEVRQLTKTFGRYPALHGVSLRIETGELVALLGPSGSGKTTLLRLIAGLEFADDASGEILFDDRPVADTRDLDKLLGSVGQRGVGFVFQHYALFRHLSVFENVAFGLRVRPRGTRPTEDAIRARVNELLQLVQLGDLGKRYPTQLSGGQRQRVALARALAIDPSVLLLDEPFGALDAKVRKDLRRWLRELQRRLRLTTVFVTHDQEEALEIADRVVVMSTGRIEQIGTPLEVYDQPATPFVMEFLGDVNRVTTPAANGQPGASTYVRPHDVAISRQPQGDGATGMEATVRALFIRGATVKVELQRTGNGEPVEAHIPRARVEELALREGDTVFVEMLKPQNLPADYSI